MAATGREGPAARPLRDLVCVVSITAFAKAGPRPKPAAHSSGRPAASVDTPIASTAVSLYRRSPLRTRSVKRSNGIRPPPPEASARHRAAFRNRVRGAAATTCVQ